MTNSQSIYCHSIASFIEYKTFEAIGESMRGNISFGEYLGLRLALSISEGKLAESEKTPKAMIKFLNNVDAMTKEFTPWVAEIAHDCGMKNCQPNIIEILDQVKRLMNESKLIKNQ